ncbi:MAG: hypothetical protein ACP5IM_06405 [Candidatus Bathyarchaeia archaeon]
MGKAGFKAEGTLAGCIGIEKPIPPNICRECAKHGDFTCERLKRRQKNGRKK